MGAGVSGVGVTQPFAEAIWALPYPFTSQTLAACPSMAGTWGRRETADISLQITTRGRLRTAPTYDLVVLGSEEWHRSQLTQIKVLAAAFLLETLGKGVQPCLHRHLEADSILKAAVAGRSSSGSTLLTLPLTPLSSHLKDP